MMVGRFTTWASVATGGGATAYLGSDRPARIAIAWARVFPVSDPVITPSDLVYPVLAITPKGFAYTVADEVALRSGNAVAVRNGYFEKLRAIDSTGAAYHVTRVHDPRIARGEWLGRIIGRLANPRMTVELELLRDRVLTLD